MNTTEHGLRIHRRYRLDIAGGSALWVLDGTVRALYMKAGEWTVVMENYRALVSISQADRPTREMTVTGDSIAIPFPNIIRTEEIPQ